MDRLERLNQGWRHVLAFSFLSFLFVFALICVWSGDAMGQSSPPLVQTFSNETMGIHSRIFSVDMGHDGIVYAASMDTDEIVAYDGANWIKIRIPSPCSSVQVGRSGKVWLCLENEVGYLQRNALNEFEYRKFEFESSTLGAEKLGKFWSCSRTKDGIRFANNRLICDLDESTEPPTESLMLAGEDETFVAWIESQIFVKNIRLEEYGIANGENRIPFKGFPFDQVNCIVSINDTLNVFVCDGWKRLKTWNDGKWTAFSTAFDELVGGQTFNWVIPMSEKRLGCGGKSGFFCMSESGELIYHVSTRDQNNLGNLYSFTEFLDNRVGLACENGFAILTPAKDRGEWRLFDHENVGVYDMYCKDGVAYVCTESGLYEFAIDKLNPIGQSLPAPVNNAMCCDCIGGESGMFFATDDGVLMKEGDKYHVVFDEPQSDIARLDDEHFIVSQMDSTKTICRLESGKFRKIQTYPSDPDQLNFFVQEDVLWSSALRGAIKAQNFPNGFASKYSDVRLNSEFDFERAWVQGFVNDDFVVLTDKGIFVSRLVSRVESESDGKADTRAGRFTTSIVLEKSDRYAQVSETIQERQICVIEECGEGRIAMGGNSVISIHELVDGVYQAEPVSEWEVAPSITGSFWDEKHKLFWLVERGRLVSIDIENSSRAGLGTPRITAIADDRVLGNSRTLLPYRGSIKLSFGLPTSTHRMENAEYQYRLKGSNGKWSDWSTKSEVEFHALSGGTYEFESRARTALEKTDVASLSFQVQYPWFLSWAALTSWLSLFGLTVYAASTWRSRNLMKANRRMEQLVVERAQEIEQKKLEIQRNSALLCESERRSESDRLKSLDTLVSGIAHDFNNLLMVISANNEMIKFSDGDEIDRYADSNATVIQSAADLCRELADYSGSLPMELVTTSLNDVVRESKDLIVNASRGDVDITFDLAEKSNRASILADRRLLKRALVNLVVNAVECSKGNVKIETSHVTLSKEDLMQARSVGNPPKPGDYCCLAVSDDGDGIDPKQMERLFDPFFSTKQLGRGLGLAIVMRATGRLNGVIFVKSTPNEGARFELHFPSTSWSSDCDETNHSKVTNDKVGLNLILVDDDLQVLNGTEQLLAAAGHQVTAIDQPKKAIDAILDYQSPSFDCLVVDVSMPEITGTEMAELILDQLPDMPIVLVSGHINSSFEIGLLSKPNVAFLNKPFSSHQINESIHQAVDGKASISHSN